MAGEEKFGYFRLSEGTEGEDGSLSSGSSWLGVLCEWRWKLTTDCFSFVCKKSCKVIRCYRSGGRWWRGTEERMKCSEEITHIWSIVDLVMEMWRFSRVDFSGERWKQRLIHTQVWQIFWFAPFCVCCPEFGSMLTKNSSCWPGGERTNVVNVEHKVSIAAFTSRDEKWVGEGRVEDTTEERWERERERRFRLKVTGKGVGGTQVAKCNLNVMKKWSEMCSGSTKILSAVQLRV